MKNLMLHAGANAATIDEVLAAPVPEPTETWHPVPYRAYLWAIRRGLDAAGLKVREKEFGLWGSEGEMLFGVLTLEGDHRPDYSMSLGIRASYNKRFSNSLVAGSRVFVCDNLAFSGEVKMARKNTRHAMDDLPGLIQDALTRVGAMWVNQDQRYDAYRGAELDERDAHDLIVRGYRDDVYPITYVADLLDEWHEPQHAEFEPRTAWSLFNCTTEVLKRANPTTLPERTQRLHRLLDGAVDLGTAVTDATPNFEI